ncbi:myb/SANT-like DNA-binding domain-containing protein 4 [Pecten maximus]|uniref:myb/SANT-like DNA-binding domain-containing protein 4 n=1 Tax=Pecten maximus TaxID=6579 RepID=UPI0014584943|nr:myb/SANT-like DNA-binding domain-containing protein 4 [Pecten maximus]
MEGDGRKRRPNFTEAECQLLVDMAVDNIDTIQCKFSSIVTIKKKAEVWQRITDSINAISCTIRTKEEIKKKWQDMVGDTRKRESARITSQRGTGGGAAPKPLSAMQEQNDINFTQTGLRNSHLKDRVGEVEGGVQPSLIGQSPYTPMLPLEPSESSETAPTPECFSNDDVTNPRQKRKKMSRTFTSDDFEDTSSTEAEHDVKLKKGRRLQTYHCEDSNKALLEIEKERLHLEKERLSIEQERKEMERERLDIEKSKLEMEQQRLKLL